ncbi:MAG: hypothetical protein V4482_00080 [Pseudomonadota bacterium]
MNKMCSMFASTALLFFTITSISANGVKKYKDSYAARQDLYKTDETTYEILTHSIDMARQLANPPLERHADRQEQQEIAAGIIQEAIIHNEHSQNYINLIEGETKEPKKVSASVQKHYGIIRNIRTLANLYAQIIWDGIKTQGLPDDKYERFAIYESLLDQNRQTALTNTIEADMGIKERGTIDQWFIREWIELDAGILNEERAIAEGEREVPYWWYNDAYIPQDLKKTRPPSHLATSAAAYAPEAEIGGMHDDELNAAIMESRLMAEQQEAGEKLDIAQATWLSQEAHTAAEIERAQDARLFEESYLIYLSEEQANKRKQELSQTARKQERERTLKLQQEEKERLRQEAAEENARALQAEEEERELQEAFELSLQKPAELVIPASISTSPALVDAPTATLTPEMDLSEVTIKHAGKTYIFDLNALKKPFESGNKNEFAKRIHLLFDASDIGKLYKEKKMSARTRKLEPTNQAEKDATQRGLLMDQIIKELKKCVLDNNWDKG